MTKSALITSINGYITSVVNIVKHRNSMLDLINEFFQTAYIMDNGAVPDQFSHRLRFKKQGNLINVDGYIRNDYSVIKGNEILVTITNSDYFAKTGQETVFAISSNYLNTGVALVGLSSIFLATNIGAGELIYINTTYQTND